MDQIANQPAQAGSEKQACQQAVGCTDSVQGLLPIPGAENGVPVCEWRPQDTMGVGATARKHQSRVNAN